MDISEKFEQLAVKIRCKSNEGSGCLFQPNSDEFTYVLTAKHCLEGKEGNIVSFSKQDIIIKRFEAKSEDTFLNVINYYLHPQLDLAVIIVDYIKDIPNVDIGIPYRNYEITMYGYPRHLKDSMTIEIRQNIESKISWLHHDFFEMTANDALMTFYNSASELIEGFSGCGVYYENENELTLIGIFKGLKSPTGAYQGLCATDVNEVNKILNQNKLPDMLPCCLLSFDSYLENAFNCHDKPIATVLTEKAKEIKKLNPKNIANLLKEKLFLPYGKKSLVNSRFWNGWILLLTYIYIDKGELLTENNFLSRIKDGEIQNIKFFYSDSLVTLDDIVRYLITELYDDLKHKDYIVINSISTPGTLYLNENRIQKIVKQIDNTVLFKNKIMIDDPHCAKDISCIHIHKFAVEIAKIEERDDMNLLYDKIKNRIMEVFNNAI